MHVPESGLLDSPQPDAAEVVPTKLATSCSGEDQTRTTRLGMQVEMHGQLGSQRRREATVRTPAALLGALISSPSVRVSASARRTETVRRSRSTSPRRRAPSSPKRRPVKPKTALTSRSWALCSHHGASLEDRGPHRAIAGRSRDCPSRGKLTGPDLSPHGSSCPKPLRRPRVPPNLPTTAPPSTGELVHGRGRTAVMSTTGWFLGLPCYPS